MKRTSIPSIALLTAIPLLLGHTSSDGGGCCAGADAECELGPLTETTCPPASTLTYASFGEPFMTTYCVACHDSQKTGADRNGAPAFHDFDTQVGVQRVLNHIDQTAAVGPAATNTVMPPDEEAAIPTLAERELLAEWLACGAP